MLTESWIKITATEIVDIAINKAVGVRRSHFASGVIKKTKGDAKMPKRQTDIQPIVYLKLNNRFFESLATWTAKAKATIATSIAKIARFDTT